MLRFLVFSFALASTYGQMPPNIPHQLAMDWDRTGKIVGGNNADIKEAPYQVALLYDYLQICGGSIISEYTIVTAAHCASGTSASSWLIRAGSTYSNQGGKVENVKRFIIHEKFNPDMSDCDIALMFLEKKIPLNGNTMDAVPLPKQDLDVPAGSMAFVTGWGATREGGSSIDVLQKVNIPIVDQYDCEDAYGFWTISSNMICAGYDIGGKDACQGDNGGPLTVNGVLIGITSWGYGCARLEFPGVWSRVPSFRNWIDEHMI